MAALEDTAPYVNDRRPNKELSHIWMRFFIPAAHRVAMANARVLTIAQMKYFATDSDKLITNLQRVIKLDTAHGFWPTDSIEEITAEMNWQAVWDAAKRDHEVAESIDAEARKDPTKMVPSSDVDRGRMWQACQISRRGREILPRSCPWG